jgi:hypothetical protein
LVAALILRETVVDALIPDPVALTINGKRPMAVFDDVFTVSVVLQVAVQLAAENVAVTPAGNEDAENTRGTGEPDLRSAVIPSEPDCPCIKERVGAAADREIEVGKAAVVNVESAETVEPPLEFVELTRK